MWNLFSFRRRNRSAQKKSGYRKPRPRVPVFEQLEKRWLMTVNLQMFNLPMANEAASTGTMLLASFSYDSGTFSQYSASVNFGDNGAGGYFVQAAAPRFE